MREFLQALLEAGGSTDMQTNKTGRYPWEFHFRRGERLTNVVIYARIKAGMLQSPPRDWSTEELIKQDYRDLKDAGGFFNDTEVCLA